MWTFAESETGSEEYVAGKPVAYKTATGEPPCIQTEAVFSIGRRFYGREHDDTMSDLDVNMPIWSKNLNTTLRAAVHLGPDDEANLRHVKNHFWNSVGQSSFREIPRNWKTDQ